MKNTTIIIFGIISILLALRWVGMTKVADQERSYYNGFVDGKASCTPTLGQLESPIKDEVQLLHAKCFQEIFALDGIKNSSDATFICDSIFWDYFCDIYPNNPRCECDGKASCSPTPDEN